MLQSVFSFFASSKIGLAMQLPDLIKNYINSVIRPAGVDLSQCIYSVEDCLLASRALTMFAMMK